MITACAIGATLLQSLDQTIANVSLPYMQGSFSASYDEITWVLTSYIIAAAIMTGPIGWMASRFGRKPLFITCIVGFTIASMACGAAQSLSQIVMFRLIQGAFSAALVPLSQAILLDIYPARTARLRHGDLGPRRDDRPDPRPDARRLPDRLLQLALRLLHQPAVRLLATVGLLMFLPNIEGQNTLRFDWIGFAVLALGIGSLQLMLDRGQNLDWFNSREIMVEAVLAGLGLYLFLVHVVCAPRPLIRPVLFRDLNFSAGLVMMFAVGTILVSSIALMAPWLQTLADYPVATAGLIMAPRGLGNVVTITISGRLSNRVDPRLMVGDRPADGMLVVLGDDDLDAGRFAAAAHHHHLHPGRRPGPGVHPAAGAGLRHPGAGAAHRGRLAVQPGPQHRRGDRRVGDHVAAGTQRADPARADRRPGDPVQSRACRQVARSSTSWHPDTPHGAALLNRIIDHQAQIIGYINDYVLMVMTTLPALLLLLLMRRPRAVAVTSEIQPAD